ncbi:MAG: hypothetical protein IMZ53_09590 [Thermoplasmata archaeon]|nr:hypothetical protein [Thermoplasmata archaeon]MBE3140822.1 hypothetical protein [Thermoplasmata archaeon]
MKKYLLFFVLAIPVIAGIGSWPGHIGSWQELNPAISTISIDSLSPDTCYWGERFYVYGNFIGHTSIDSLHVEDSTCDSSTISSTMLSALMPHLPIGWYADTFIVSDGAINDTLFTDSIYCAGSGINQFTLTISNDGHGLATPDGVNIVDSGVTTAITHTVVDESYSFSHWHVLAGTPVFNVDSTTVVCNGDVSIRADFIFKQFTITIIAAHGTTSPSEGDTVVDSAGTFTLSTPTIDAGWEYAVPKYTITAGTFNGDSTTYTASANATITVNYTEKQFHLIVSAYPDNGTIVPAKGDTLVDSNSTIAISQVPDAGYTFTVWSVSGGATLAVDSSTVTVRAPGTLMANYSSPASANSDNQRSRIMCRRRDVSVEIPLTQ